MRIARVLSWLTERKRYLYLAPGGCATVEVFIFLLYWLWAGFEASGPSSLRELSCLALDFKHVKLRTL